MNLKDPFNRLGCRDQSELVTLTQQLYEAGIDSEEKALEVLRQSRKRMLNYCVILVVIGLAIVVIVPEALAVVVVFGGLLLLWLLTSLSRGQRMLKQFILREFHT